MTDTNQPQSIDENSQVYLVDGSSYIFRAYHALPPLTRRSDKLPVGAVAGFCNMLWRLVQEPVGEKAPTHIAVLFDHSSKTFRNDIYADYKGHRPDTPEDLKPQFPLIRSATEAFGIPSIELEGYEADDLIATYAKQAAEKGAEVTIIASDKDLMQLVNDKIIMFDTMKDKRIADEEVRAKFGVGPDKVIEVQALAGDSTDNIPGVPGIGIKTAAMLIEEFGDLETLLEQAETIKQKKRRENLIEFADLARVSHKLVTLAQDVPVEVPLDDFQVISPDVSRLVGFLKAMEFNTLTKRIATALEADAELIEADSDFAADANSADKSDLENLSSGGDYTPQLLAAKVAADYANLSVDRNQYETVTTLEQLQVYIHAAFETGLLAIDTETTSLDAMQADLVGISLSSEVGKACYIPLQHRASDGFAFEEAGLDQLPLNDALELLKPVLQDPSVLKIGQNLKYDLLVLSRYGIDITPYDDTMLLSYVSEAGLHGHGMDELSKLHFNHEPVPFKEVCGTGKKQITFDLVPIPKATEYAAEDADITLRLHKVLKPKLAAEQVANVYETLERPLVKVLQRMEKEGIKVDRQMLSRLSGEFAQKLAALEAELEVLAGEAFNPGSPKQVGDILFGKMNLPGAKKTATGAWSTGADVLEDLAAQGHDLPVKLLEWRQLSKLKSTYTDALQTYINPQTGRVHSSFALAATTTGRLSSSEPNVQNIPIRTEEGRRIRTAFVAESGNKLISADYSQIELRVLAHIADIDALKKAFEDGLDIHAMTASEMFGVPIQDMDPMVRRRAKAINFGIIYGISAFGLANQLSISRTEAGDYIKTYFERFPGIKDYMEVTKEACRAQGYVTTLFGRKCHYPEINTKNPQKRGFFERAAINAPIQGTAADIIRRAMVRMHGALEDAGLNTKMLLQVHDELVFEAPEAEADKTIHVARKVMEGAPEPLLKLSVPLVVDANAADNWDEAH